MRKLGVLIILLFASVCLAKDSPKPRPISYGPEVDRWAEKTLKKMSLEEKVGQLLMPWSRAAFYNINGPDYAALRDVMKKYHVGGFGLTVATDGPLLLRNQPYEAAMLTNQLQRDSKYPLLFGADFERGLYMRLNGTTGFPHAMAFGAANNKDYAFAFGRITAEESRAIGVHWNWFPDADVNSNPKNPIINTRSFGEDPAQVSQMVSAYIAGARGAGMLTTVKHFPGHGDTSTDTHLALARIDATLDRLSSVELVPFRDAITAGVDSVMVSHIIVPALESDPNRPATISSSVITGQLLQKMAFKGLVVTDAMDMQGVMKTYDPALGNPSARAAVDALKAGADMILIPADLDGAYNGILNAVRSKQISESRIDQSVLKVLAAKAAVGLNKSRTVDIDALSTGIMRPENMALAQQVADDSITLVRDSGRLLPLKSSGTLLTTVAYQPMQTQNRLLAVVFSDDVRGETGRVFEKQLRARVPDANIIFVDPKIAPGMAPLVLQAMRDATTIIAAVSVVPGAGRVIQGAATGSADLAGDQASLLRTLLAQAADRTVLLTLGNPYVVSDFPEAQIYMCSYSNAPVSETAVVKALFGEIPIRGRLPVTIPNIAPRGAGIDRPLAK
jgi:beta-N-acetylhexosaminidase